MRVVVFGAALQSFPDIAAEHILAAHDFHGLHNGAADDGFAESGAKALKPTVGVFGYFAVEADNLAGEHKPPRGGIDEGGLRLAAVLVPFAGEDFFGDQAVGGVCVGHSQKRFGEAHKRDAFVVGQSKLQEECVK